MDTEHQLIIMGVVICCNMQALKSGWDPKLWPFSQQKLSGAILVWYSLCFVFDSHIKSD